MLDNMKELAFRTPVLFLIFNRPDTTKRVFKEIRRVKPTELYIAADGPREAKPDETELCNETRAIVKEIDWDCEIHTLFRDKNLGCKKAVSSAIDWFFDNVDAGIILEDDCVPDQSFFGFCQELINYYKDDSRVMMISGTNYLFNKIELSESYFFSRYYPVWGWATWKRAWKLYDRNMSSWPEYKTSGQLDVIHQDKKIKKFFERIFIKTYEHKVNTWDYQWVFSCVSNNGLAAIPKYNLIANIGLYGVHSNGIIDRFSNMPMKAIDIDNLVHPLTVSPNTFLDKITFNTIFSNPVRSGLIHFLRSKICIKDSTEDS
jgi:hypothetical protein